MSCSSFCRTDKSARLTRAAACAGLQGSLAAFARDETAWLDEPVSRSLRCRRDIGCPTSPSQRQRPNAKDQVPGLLRPLLVCCQEQRAGSVSHRFAGIGGASSGGKVDYYAIYELGTCRDRGAAAIRTDSWRFSVLRNLPATLWAMQEQGSDYCTSHSKGGHVPACAGRTPRARMKPLMGRAKEGSDSRLLPGGHDCRHGYCESGCRSLRSDRHRKVWGFDGTGTDGRRIGPPRGSVRQGG